MGPICTSVDYPEPIAQWTNRDSIETVERGKDLTITWTAGDPAGYMQILGFSTAVAGKEATASFVCTARTADRTFTVPAHIAAVMPAADPSVPGAVWPPSFWLQSQTKPERFQPAGVDLGIFNVLASDVKAVTCR